MIESDMAMVTVHSHADTCLSFCLQIALEWGRESETTH